MVAKEKLKIAEENVEIAEEKAKVAEQQVEVAEDNVKLAKGEKVNDGFVRKVLLTDDPEEPLRPIERLLSQPLNQPVPIKPSLTFRSL
jgi:hypothetical protein